MQRQRDPGKFLRDNGLLAIINHQILHPIGYALAVTTEVDEDGVPVEKEEDTEVAEICLLHTEDAEGWLYQEDTFAEGILKYRKFMQEEGSTRMAQRKEEVGFTIQPLPKDVIARLAADLLERPPNAPKPDAL